MRPIDRNHDEFEDFDDFAYGGVGALRRMIHDRQTSRKRGRMIQAEKESWDDDYSDYEDYDDDTYTDYNEDEFDRFSGLDFDKN